MRKIRVSAHISLQYPHEGKAVQERQQVEKSIHNGGYTMSIEILAVNKNNPLAII